ncbi:MAG: hypothetical protein HRT36_06800 [Alphaproteobacteria bacterium]|nr:hypothetical protein [Alphaproteobacteria bacterium]
MSPISGCGDDYLEGLQQAGLGGKIEVSFEGNLATISERWDECSQSLPGAQRWRTQHSVRQCGLFLKSARHHDEVAPSPDVDGAVKFIRTVLFPEQVVPTWRGAVE